MKGSLYVLLLGSAFAVSTNVYSMAEGPVINFDASYKVTTKELDLAGIPLGDEGLKNRMEDIKSFVEKYGVERIMLNVTGLTRVPFELIGFATVNKTLKYISLKQNKFLPDSVDDFTKMPTQSQKSVVLKYLANFLGKLVTTKSSDFLMLDVDFMDESIVIGKSFGFSSSKLITVPILLLIGAGVIYFSPQLAGYWVQNFPSTCDAEVLQALAHACKF